MLDKVAIVILNWNGKSFLSQFLPTVIKHSALAKIYVADNCSTDGSLAFITQHYPSITIIKNDKNDGFAKGYNDALAQVKASYYVLLNSDVEVTENWLMPIVTLLDENKDIAACQPKILDYNNKNKFEYAGACGGYIDTYGYPFCRGRLFSNLETDDNQYNNLQEIFWATGACLFIRSQAFWHVNGFDGDYFAHMEEIDLCWRLKNRGYQIYVQPASVVYHVGGGTLNKINPKKTFLNFKNNLITYTKNAPSNYLFFKILWRLVLDGVAGIKFLVEGNFSHFVAVIKAHFSYYFSIKKTLQKRKKLRQDKNFKQTQTAILNNNIVYLYFIKGITKFSQIKF